MRPLISLTRTKKADLFPVVCRAQVAATLVTSTSFVLRPNALAPGETYTFVLTATDAGGTASAEVSVVVSRAPYGLGGPETVGALVVALARPPAARGQGSSPPPFPSPSSSSSSTDGVAFSSAYSLSVAGWADVPGDGPYQFQFQYLPPDGGDPVVLSQFQPRSSLSGVKLPAGLDASDNRVTLQLCVRHADPSRIVFANHFLTPAAAPRTQAGRKSVRSNLAPGVGVGPRHPPKLPERRAGESVPRANCGERCGGANRQQQ